MDVAKTALFLGYKTGEIKRFFEGESENRLTFTGDLPPEIMWFSMYPPKTSLAQVFLYLRNKAVFGVELPGESPTPNDLGFWKHSQRKEPRYSRCRD